MTLCISCCDSCIACALIDLAKCVIGWTCAAIIVSSFVKSPALQQWIRSCYDLKKTSLEKEQEKKEGK